MGRCACHEPALRVQPPRPRRRQLDEVGDGSRSTLLRETDQMDEHLRGGAGIGQRPMTRSRRHAEEVGQLGEADPPRTPVEEPPREPDGVDDGSCHPPSAEPLHLAVEEREIEACIVRDQHRIPGELQKAAHRMLAAWRSTQRGGLDPSERSHGGGERDAGIDQRLEGLPELEAADALGADLADPRRSRTQTGRLEVEDDEGCLLERDATLHGVRKAEQTAAAPGESHVPLDDIVEESPGDAGRSAGEREQGARRLVCRQWAPLRLDQLDETIGGIEGQLHTRQPRRTYVRLQVPVPEVPVPGCSRTPGSRGSGSPCLCGRPTPAAKPEARARGREADAFRVMRGRDPRTRIP